jgi:hypothetical protein
MRAVPGLAAALASGRITYTKALIVARDASPCDVEARIEEVASTTWQQAERDSTAEEDRRNRALGERRLWGPRDASETVALAISAAQAHFEARGEVISAGRGARADGGPLPGGVGAVRRRRLRASAPLDPGAGIRARAGPLPNQLLMA